MKVQYTVVENAGYVGECDVRSFDTYSRAAAFAHRNYPGEEIDELNVAVRRDNPDGTSTYEL
jgi:hypothetical protein